MDLCDQVDWSAVECLNQQPDHAVANALKQVCYVEALITTHLTGGVAHGYDTCRDTGRMMAFILSQTLMSSCSCTLLFSKVSLI